MHRWHARAHEKRTWHGHLARERVRLKHGLESHATSFSEQLAEMFDCETRIFYDSGHCECIYRISARDGQEANAIGHHDMPALANNSKPGLLQRTNGLGVGNPGEFRHG